MGAYLNPANMTKEAWLKENAEASPNSEPPTQYDAFFGTSKDDPTLMYVCLVNNGPFTAAAIAYSQAELEVFSNVHDYRPKLWYLVDKTKLMDPEVSELHHYLPA